MHLSLLQLHHLFGFWRCNFSFVKLPLTRCRPLPAEWLVRVLLSWEIPDVQNPPRITSRNADRAICSIVSCACIYHWGAKTLDTSQNLLWIQLMKCDAIQYIMKVARNSFDATVLALQVQSCKDMMQSIAVLKSNRIYLMQRDAIHSRQKTLHTVVSKLITNRDFVWGEFISDYRYRLALPEELLSITETDLWEFQKISHYRYRFSLEFQVISITDTDMIVRPKSNSFCNRFGYNGT